MLRLKRCGHEAHRARISVFVGVLRVYRSVMIKG